MEAGSAHEASSHTETTSTLRKYIPFDLDTAAITESAAEYLDPEKLTPLLNEHKSLLPKPCGLHTPDANTDNASQAESLSPPSG
jgi:hypothetical protein